MITEATKSEINKSLRKGLKTLERPEPLRLSEYADKHFYLSAESSYVEGKWETMPYQKAIMDCISNDDIREVTLKKSARVGYTKMLLAAINYFAEHKKRKQAIWQPTDDDADEFVKTEINTMLRDVPSIRRVFPWYDKKHANNTLRQKIFIGSVLLIRGGKAAKNFRRITVDVVMGDEIDAFDRDVEREGSPRKLYGKRVEGATFPKIINGSTPKIKGQSLIEDTIALSEFVFRYHIPCPKCKHLHPLMWGGKDVDGGMKWEDNNPHTVKQQCPKCKILYTQDEYLKVWDKGRHQSECGVWIDPDCIFRDKKNKIIDTPMTVGFDYLWTAYSPMTSWTQIIREWIGSQGKPSDLKTFINQTLGETWEEDESEKTEHQLIYHRREKYLSSVPAGVVTLTAGIDTQDDRIEYQVDGWGGGEERWTIDYVRLFGDPSRMELWNKLFEYLRRNYIREDGIKLNIRLACQDHGGHYSDEVNAFSKKCGLLWLIPVKGSSQYGKPVSMFPRKRNKKGVYLTEVGTDTAKELLFQRLKIFEPGPGYWHFPISEKFDEEYFRQLTNEERVPRWVKGVRQFYWDAKSRRQEPWDCSVYSLAAIRILQQHMGINLEGEQVVRTGRRYRSKGVQ